MLRRMPIYLILTMVIVVSFVLAGCGGSTTTTMTATSTQTATMTATETSTQTSTQTATTTATTTATETVNKYGGVYHFPLTVSPARPIGYPPEAAPDSYTDASPALESLVRLKADGSIEGLLATSWEVAADQKSITISLRKGVRFHDGSDFNADVCKWNLDMAIAAGTATAWVSVDKIDDYTVRINLDHFDNTILTGLAGGTTQQISKQTFDSKGVDYCRWHPVGTGPFIFESYEPDSKLTYNRNPDYWEAGKPYLDGITMDIIADETVRKLAFQRGDVQSFAPLSLLDAKEFKESGQYNLELGGGGPYVLIPDSMNPNSPWANYKVRLAASYALNREDLATALGFGFAIPAYQLFQSFPELNIPGLVKTEYNPDKAKQLLTEAGYPNGFKTVIHGFTRIVPADYLNAVAAQLGAVGIQCDIDLPTSAAYSDLRYGTWDGLMGHGIGNFDNKNQDFTFYFTGLQFQYCAKPAGWQAAVDASLASPEPDPQLIQNVLKIMYDDMMVIPYLEQSAFLFTEKGFHDDSNGAYGVRPGMSICPWQYIWFDDTLK